MERYYASPNALDIGGPAYWLVRDREQAHAIVGSHRHYWQAYQEARDLNEALASSTQEEATQDGTGDS